MKKYILLILIANAVHAGPIHKAARNGNLANEGVDPNQKNQNPLHDAIRQVDHNKVSVLVDEGHNPYEVNSNGKTAFDLAIEIGQRTEDILYRSKFVDSLVKKFKQAIKDNVIQALQDLLDKPHNMSELRQEDLLEYAVKKNNIEIVKLLLSTDFKNANFAKATAQAVENNNIEILRTLLDAGASPNSQSSRTTPLIKAVKKGNNEIAEILIEYGADVNKTSLDNETPLSAAYLNDHMDIATMLINKGADVNLNKLLAYYLVIRERQDLLQSLLDNGFDIKNDSYVLAAIPRPKMVEFLIEKGADVNARSRGLTPLYRSVNIHHLKTRHDVVKMLLDAGADVNAGDDVGETPLMLATRERSLDINVINMLLNAGADVEGIDINALDRDSDATILLQAHKNPNIKYGIGITPLMKAAQKGYTKLVEILLEKGFNPNVKDAQGNTALMRARQAQHDREKIIQLLIQNGADINNQRNDGNTALMRAADYGDEDLVNVLLNNGANTSLHNDNGQSAVDIAEGKGFNNIVSIIKRHAELVLEAGIGEL